VTNSGDGTNIEQLSPRCDGQEDKTSGVGMVMTADAGKSRLRQKSGKRGKDTYNGARTRRVLEAVGALGEGGLHPLSGRGWREETCSGRSWTGCHESGLMARHGDGLRKF